MRQAHRFLVLAAVGSILTGCGVTIHEPKLHVPAETPRHEKGSPAIKAHMKSGEVYVLHTWSLSPEQTLRGEGREYGIDRVERSHGSFSLPLDSIALVETDSTRNVYPAGLQVMAVLTTFWGSLATYCSLDPKACFGSCPTFYAEGGSSDRPVAEGFSDSIAKVLEARDLDALFDVRPTSRSFTLLMRNEALETHAVRRVRLLAARRPAGGRVLADGNGRLYPATSIRPPLSCLAPEGNCSEMVRARDSLERSSLADPEDLAARETVELEFPPAEGPSGLVLGARQTLVSTFVLYQTMAWMGRSAGDWLAAMERGGRETTERAMGTIRLLGGIDVAVEEAGGWRTIGSYREAGPIAGDVQVIPFTPPPGRLRVRLTMAKGSWRLDVVALAQLLAPMSPRVVALDRVEHEGRVDASALARLSGTGPRLITTPGDEYRLVFRLPEPVSEQELFLESEGYYYEWMRGEWLAEEDPAMLAMAMLRPDETLRRLAGPFKEREGRMEQVFWASRYRR